MADTPSDDTLALMVYGDSRVQRFVVRVENLIERWFLRMARRVGGVVD